MYLPWYGENHVPGNRKKKKLKPSHGLESGGHTFIFCRGSLTQTEPNHHHQPHRKIYTRKRFKSHCDGNFFVLMAAKKRKKKRKQQCCRQSSAEFKLLVLSHQPRDNGPTDWQCTRLGESLLKRNHRNDLLSSAVRSRLTKWNIFDVGGCANWVRSISCTIL